MHGIWRSKRSEEFTKMENLNYLHSVSWNVMLAGPLNIKYKMSGLVSIMHKINVPLLLPWQNRMTFHATSQGFWYLFIQLVAHLISFPQPMRSLPVALLAQYPEVRPQVIWTWTSLCPEPSRRTCHWPHAMHSWQPRRPWNRLGGSPPMNGTRSRLVREWGSFDVSMLLSLMLWVCSL